MFNSAPITNVKRMIALPHLKAKTCGCEYFAPMFMMEINLRHEPIKASPVRQAKMHALDCKFIAESIWFGFAKPATGPIASTSTFYKSVPPSIRSTILAIALDALNPRLRDP